MIRLRGAAREQYEKRAPPRQQCGSGARAHTGTSMPQNQGIRGRFWRGVSKEKAEVSMGVTNGTAKRIITAGGFNRIGEGPEDGGPSAPPDSCGQGAAPPRTPRIHIVYAGGLGGAAPLPKAPRPLVPSDPHLVMGTLGGLSKETPEINGGGFRRRRSRY